MTSQIIKVHKAAHIPSSYIDIGIIFGILFCVIGLVFVIYAAKYYR